ncbi:hypothetical protein EON65_42280 [archaeon]|nr:MAG: hypothetical protein EON65_42280 [archaeon]
MKLDTLSWIAKFQSAFQVYYIMRIFGHELDVSAALLQEKRNRQQEEKTEGNNKLDASSLPIDESSNNLTSIGQISNKTCVLCLEPMNHPAVIPCGHTFCWTCIFSFANKQHSKMETDEGEEDEDQTSSGCSCPICRVEFTKFKIRALHAYM